jgi:protoheme IX farnesyltransferase
VQRSVALATPVSRIADYAELTKPRITLMVVLTTAAGYYLGAQGSFDLVVLLHALLGTGVIASAASALNQVLERDSDARMLRTRHRPLPAGRMEVSAALGFGLVLTVLGTLYLAVAVNVLTAVVGAATLALYVLVYTPMKRRSSLVSLTGSLYFYGAFVLGIAYLAAGIHAARERSHASAGLLLRVSVIYLPALLGLMTFDKVVP